MIVADDAGGCYIAAVINGNGDDIYMQRVDNNGIAWGASGSVVCNANYDQWDPSITYVNSDGGIVVAWTDRRNASTNGMDIYAQEMASNGNCAWAQNGVAVATAANDQKNPIVGLVGIDNNYTREACVAWSDGRQDVAGRADLYVQRLSMADGSGRWTASGVCVNGTPDFFQIPRAVLIVPDGVILTWTATNAGAGQYYIYAARLWWADGTIYWGTGVAGGTSGYKKDIATVGDGAGGFVMSWSDQDANEYNIYATRFISTGSPLHGEPAPGWAGGGNAICLASGDQVQTAVSLTTAGGLLVSWYAGGDVYEQATTSGGTIVTMPPKPTGVAASDNVGDGVTVSWNDVCGETEYRVYRDSTQIATVPADETSYLDRNDLPTSPPVGTYEYCVRSYRSAGGLSDAGCDAGSMPPAFQIISPNGGEFWLPNSQQTVQWFGSNDPVTIQLFVDGAPSNGSMQGVSVTLATGIIGGQYTFTVPDAATTRARVQLVKTVGAETKYSYSAAPFKIGTLPLEGTWSYSFVDEPSDAYPGHDMCANGSGGVDAVYRNVPAGMVRHAYKANKTQPWTREAVTTISTVGNGPSLARGSDGSLHAAFYGYNYGAFTLYYEVRSNGTWILPPKVVDGVGSMQGDCSIAVANDGIPWIAYSRVYQGTSAIKVVRKSGLQWQDCGPAVTTIGDIDHVTLKRNGAEYYLLYTDQSGGRLNLWKYNGTQWVQLQAGVFDPATGPYTDASLTIDSYGYPALAYTVPNSTTDGQVLLFQGWAQEGGGLGAPLTIDDSPGAISSVDLEYYFGLNLPRIAYLGNGVVKEAIGILSETEWPCAWGKDVVDATGNMSGQIALAVQGSGDCWFMYYDSTNGRIRSAHPYYLDEPPTAVSDLAFNAGRTTGVLSWTTPGDGPNGQTTAYDLRYALNAITTEIGFVNATPWPISPPGGAGSFVCVSLTGLASGMPYYWAIKTQDNAGQWSALSNSPGGWTGRNGPQVLCAFEGGELNVMTQTGPELPKTFELAQASPNPFNPATTLSFALPREEQVRLNIYDLSGRLVRTLVNEVRPAGRYEVRWDGTTDGGRRVASGVYFCRMEAGDFRENRRMMLVK